MLLGPDDPLPRRPSRIVVAGVSGSGKTTLARRAAARLGVPHVEIDALFHGPGWRPRPEFLADVERLVVREEWVTEWQYAAARPLLLARADLMVWLDLPVARTMTQVTVRTVTRRVGRVELWNGNREGPLLGVLHQPDHIIRWAWRTRHKYDGLPERVEAVRRARALPDLPVVRLRSHRDSRRWCDGPLAASTV
ncbi:adenylate kinase family enzyme [Georgenia soli]|uniref:Adenylate kinase family enzyme n=1 Tax=Georgenia soli TaxID=638953 RepID=A0A2A9EPX2_9MICO|nr:AAA family ATPase [Georgenia soli]PFG40823.1 adenylate kinase family enzyme [Georgenia soli]